MAGKHRKTVVRAVPPPAPAEAPAVAAAPHRGSIATTVDEATALARPAPETLARRAAPPPDPLAAWTAGVGAIGRELVGYANGSVENAICTATALLKAKTLEEVMVLQADLARLTLEEMVRRSTRLSELGTAILTGLTRDLAA